MALTSPNMPALAVALLLVAAFIAACVGFGVIQTVLIIALAATAAMLFAFLRAAYSKEGH